MDVARYFRQQSDGGVREGLNKRNATHLDVEPDGDVPENKAYRYWSGEAMALELRRDFRRIRIRPLSPSATTMINRQKLDPFIPLESKEINKVFGNLLLSSELFGKPASIEMFRTMFKLSQYHFVLVMLLFG